MKQTALTIPFECIPFEQLSLHQLYAIMALRQQVFMIEQTCYYLDADGMDQKAWHLMGMDQEGNIVAYARLLPPGTPFDGYTSIGRVLTAHSVRRTGAGKVLLEQAIERTSGIFGDYPIQISAQCYLLHFYRSFGFVEVGAEYLEDGIPHIHMIRE
jgi:ElaA protein